MNFECNQNRNNCTNKPSVDCIKVDSVICSKCVNKVAEITLPALDIGIPGDQDLALVDFQVQANQAGIVMRGTVVDGLVVNSGYVPVSVTVLLAGIALPAFTINLPFQEETKCPGACPGDKLEETQPTVVSTLTPVFTPQVSVAGITLAGTVTFKAIISTNITVSRQKLVYSPVNPIADVSCKNSSCCPNGGNTTPTTQTFFP